MTKQQLLKQYDKALESLLSLSRQDNDFTQAKHSARISILDKWLVWEFKKNWIKICLPAGKGVK